MCKDLFLNHRIKRTIALWITLCWLLGACGLTLSPPDFEATVQVAVQQTIAAPTPQGSPIAPTPTFEDALSVLQDKFATLCWVAYSPTHFDPDQGIYPSETEIREDLRVLHSAGFRGLTTYGAELVLQHVPRIARDLGFEGVIMGVWSPVSAEELTNAKQAAAYVDGYSIGNEGLFFGRYDFDTLKAAMDDVRATTQKPVATADVMSSYFDNADLRSLGDWIFPTAHPYWNGNKVPQAAATWTEQQFIALSELYIATPRLIVFKEVGLPTAGDPEVSEAGQAEYYRLLRATNVKFFYFEAFDQSWKTSQPVEPYWGVFRSDRSPKPVVDHICAKALLRLPLIVWQAVAVQ